MSGNVAQGRHCHIRVGHSRKYGVLEVGRRGAITHRLKVISTSGLMAAIWISVVDNVGQFSQ